MRSQIESIVFGGSGFIGKHLTESLGDNFVNVDIVKDQANDFYCDVRKSIDIDLKLQSNSMIYNLAALCTIPMYKEHEYYDTNVRGAINVCNFSRQKNIKTIIFISSISPYGMREEIRSENSIPMPTNEYGISKLVAEHIHRTWQAEKSDERCLIILRPGIVFGKREGGNFTRLYEAMSKGIFFYPGRKDSRKASIYVKDLVRIMIEMAEKAKPGVTLYNCCYSQPHTIEEICQAIAKVTGIRKPNIILPAWLMQSIAATISLSSKVLGKTLMGINSDRIKKLMISTNINGQKLIEHGYQIEYSLEKALVDWLKSCGGKGLY